jgi:hypothetical protein
LTISSVINDESLQIEKYLYWKDKSFVSDKSFDLWSKIVDNKGPRIHSVRNYRSDINKKCEVIQVDPNSFFYDVRKIMLMNLYSYIERVEGPVGKIKIKIGADSTNIGRVTKLTNITFTILNDHEHCMSASGNFTLGIVIGKDDHENLRNSFIHLMKILKELHSFTFKNEKYEIKYYFGGDWVVTANLLGIKGAISKFPCLWCTKNKADFGKPDIKSTRRTMQFQKQCLNDKKDKEKFCYENLSLLEDIENMDCVVDTLHMFLRITDILFDEFLRLLGSADIYNQDKFEKLKSNLNGQITNERFPRLEAFITFLKTNCGIKVSLNKGDIVGKLRGPEKKRIFQKVEELGLVDIFKIGNLKVADIVKIEKLWKDFFSIYKEVTTLEEVNPESIRIKTSEWLHLFKTIYAKERITPYIHVFVEHLWEFVQRHKVVHIFNTEGLYFESFFHFLFNSFTFNYYYLSL